MWYEFSNRLNNIFGDIIGSEAHLKRKRDAAKPVRGSNETFADFTQRSINLSKSFNKSYWLKAKIKRVAIVVVLLLFITNPGHSSFISFEKSQIHYPEILCGRKYNFFICSVYQAGAKEYIGIMGNFFEENKPIPQPVIQESADTTKKM